MGDLNIKIRSRDLYLIFAVIVFLIGVGFIIAYNPTGTGTPAAMGHSLNEIEMPNCANGEILKKNAGVWGCSPDAGGAGNLDCTTKSFTGASSGSVCCDAGYQATGWGSTDTTPSVIFSGTNCISISSVISSDTTYVKCCRVV